MLPAGRGLASFLFTYPGRPHRREHLADLFWPNLDYEHARRALNSAVWRLRRLLAQHPQSAGGQNLKTIGSETLLEHAPWLDIDAVALLEASSLVQKRPAALHDEDVLNRVMAVARSGRQSRNKRRNMASERGHPRSHSSTRRSS
jgi:DNA-binding SARP family transcriptional activator